MIITGECVYMGYMSSRSIESSCSLYSKAISYGMLLVWGLRFFVRWWFFLGFVLSGVVVCVGLRVMCRSGVLGRVCGRWGRGGGGGWGGGGGGW